MAITNSIQPVSISKQTRKQTYASKLISSMPKDTLSISAQAKSLATQMKSTQSIQSKAAGGTEVSNQKDTSGNAKSGPVIVPIKPDV